MSGGKWNYIQYRLTDVIEDIEKEVNNSGQPLSKEEIKNSYHDSDWFEKYPEEKFHRKYPDEVIKEFKNAIEIISRAQVYMQRIDWLFCDDDGDESFIERLESDLKKLEKQ